MTPYPRSRGLLRVVSTLAAALAVLVVASAASAGPPPVFTAPQRYYLALGDSLTYGFSTAKALAGLPPVAFDTGYVDHFAARLRHIRPEITTVNYGCPGESTTSFLTEPCIWRASGHALHDDYPGPQIDAALAFLRTHRGSVSPIPCGATTSGCSSRPVVTANASANGAAAAISQLTANLAEILRRLRTEAPEAEIIVTGAYNPYLGLLPVADPLIQTLNTAMAETAAGLRARFADPFAIFNPQGDPAAEVAALCVLTLLCTEGDSHPSDAGYRVIADEVFAASGYERLGGSRRCGYVVAATERSLSQSAPTDSR